MLNLLAPLVRWQTLKFERLYNYDTQYLRKLFALSPGAFMRFRHVLENADFAQNVPAAALFAVKFLAIAREDCGPCAQLTLDQAREAGVPTQDLQALVARSPERLSPDALLAWNYAQAVLDHSPETVQWCEAVVSRWGSPALASLALALVTSRSFPAMKQALGVATATCQRLEVKP
jgi:alkylhydroperoxidase family enzyme